VTTTALDEPSFAEPAFAEPARRTAWRLRGHDAAAYNIAWIGWVLFHASPAPIGLLLKFVLDRAAPGDGASVWWMLAALGAAEGARWLLLLAMVVQWNGAWVQWNTVPRMNMMRSLATDPGPVAGRLPSSSGEAVSRFRDDSQNLALVLDVWLDLSGAIVASASALALMLVIDWRIALLGVLPVVAALSLSRFLGAWVRKWRRIEREATGAVTGFIGDTFGGVQAVQATGSAAAIAQRFDDLGERRADAARRDQIVMQLLSTMSGATGNLAIGLMLLLLAPRVSRGELSTGDVGLFVAEASVLASLPRWAARSTTYHRQAEVSVRRMAELTSAPESSDALVGPVSLALRRGPGAMTAVSAPPPSRRTGGDRFEALSVRGFTVEYPGGGGISDVDLDVPRGSVTVITGAVGAGKSTLVRALLGLVGHDSGSVAWNGVPIDDLSAWMVPPRAAYVPQVPRLFSEPLADTILLGLGADGLAEAIDVAALADDVAEMPDGLSTLVGPKGVRLSGGQVQRTAAARALVRRPELLIVDDLSSALDVATEARLWDRLLSAGDGMTLLVVSHRRFLLDRADQVVTLRAGRRR
jgi:ATP-binding cassette subfamily B protein